MLSWVGLGLLQTHLLAIPVMRLSLPESLRNLSKSSFCFKASEPLEAATSADTQVLRMKWHVCSPTDITTNASPHPQRHSQPNLFTVLQTHILRRCTPELTMLHGAPVTGAPAPPASGLPKLNPPCHRSAFGPDF